MGTVKLDEMSSMISERLYQDILHSKIIIRGISFMYLNINITFYSSATLIKSLYPFSLNKILVIFVMNVKKGWDGDQDIRKGLVKNS